MSKMKSFNLAKRISFAMLLVLILFVSISSIQAGDVNETILNSNEDIALSIENLRLTKMYWSKILKIRHN